MHVDWLDKTKEGGYFILCCLPNVEKYFHILRLSESIEFVQSTFVLLIHSIRTKQL